MIDPHFAESLAMSYGVEDICGAYELIWGLNRHYPDEPPEVKRAVSEAALLRLVRAGLIELYAGGLSDPSQAPPVPEAEAVAAIVSPSFWLPPFGTSDPQGFWFLTTAAGDRAYYEGQFKSL